MNVLAQILDHPLGHRLGWALLHSIWQGALGAAVFAVIRLGLRRRSANARYLAACLMLVALIAAPVITLICIPEAKARAFPTASGNGQRRPGQGSIGHKAAAQVLGVTAPTAQYLQRTTAALDRSLPWMVELWALGVIALACRWLHGTRWVRHVRTFDTEPLNPAWLSRLNDLSARLSITRPVRLLKSTLVEVPMVVGWLRPVILLPASVLVGLTPEQLEAILAHELAHVRRYDYLVNTFQNLVETLMFYHPAVWWISRCIRDEREHCCDDLVVRVCGDRMVYARALVTLEESRGFPRLALAATGGSLLHRVRRLLRVSNEDRPPSAVEFGGITLVAVGCACIVAAIWLFNSPSIYQAAALVRVHPTLALQKAATDATGSVATYYPYLLQTECFVIRSPAVLDRAIRSLGLTDMAGQPQTSRDRSSKAGALSLLRVRLNLQPVPSSSVIEIQASDADPGEAARIANAVAVSYKEYRRDQYRKSIRDGLDGLEERFLEYEKKVRQAQEKVDRLRVEFKVPDAVASGNEPPALLTAETLRHMEGLRIEGQAEYIKQKTLLERLEELEPKDLAATIPAVGVQDNQLTGYLQAQAAVEQKLISLKTEFGPQHPEVLKAEVQQVDLREKIAARTIGILKGLQAKVDSTGQSLAALSKEMEQAQISDIEAAKRTQPYYEAKRDLEELVRFRQILNMKIAMEKTDLQLPGEPVEVVEEAVAPLQAVAPNRPRATALLAAGLALALIGWLMAKADRSGVRIATAT